MRVAKWGNSLAVRLPKDVIEALGLKEGDDVTITKRIDKEREPVREIAIEKENRHAALEKLRDLRIQFPDDYKFDREEASARGKWDEK